MKEKLKEWKQRMVIGMDRSICLRALEPRDAGRIISFLQDSRILEKLRYFSFFQNTPTLEQEEAYLKRMSESETDLLMGIETADENLQLIGATGLHEIDFWNQNCRFGIIIFDPAFWNRGFAKATARVVQTLAFRELGINKIYLTPRLDNGQAIEIYKKLGFKPEGVLREEYKVKEGQYLDLLRMSILRKEWELKTEG